MGKICLHAYNDIISLENLLEAWNEFIKGKRKRKDVQEFERNLMSNIICLHNNLSTKIYNHSPYKAFNICDPKPRNVHKAEVRDRLLHHAIYRVLYPYFDSKFIHYSFSCRLNKGTHRAMNMFRQFYLKESKNRTKTVWVLKCDIKKFFASIDHAILKSILAKYIADADVLWVLSRVIDSFYSTKEGVGLPLGNLTSQLLVNIYMNEFDQFIKHQLKAKYYIRYADDFVVLSRDKQLPEDILLHMHAFLSEKLKLSLHPDIVSGFIKPRKWF